MTDEAALTCRYCSQGHRRPGLVRGQRAYCSRCGALLARRSVFGPAAARAFALTGLVLAIPAFVLPLVTVSNIGGVRDGFVLTGADALWDDRMRTLGVWVAICGGAAPLLLLGLLSLVLWPRPLAGQPQLRQRLRHAAEALEYWSAPEVHVLAVLVALTKLGHLVQVRIGPGFWFYAGMSVATLLAWRSFEMEPAAPRPAAAPA